MSLTRFDKIWETQSNSAQEKTFPAKLQKGWSFFDPWKLCQRKLLEPKLQKVCSLLSLIIPEKDNLLCKYILTGPCGGRYVHDSRCPRDEVCTWHHLSRGWGMYMTSRSTDFFRSEKFILLLFHPSKILIESCCYQRHTAVTIYR